jgi:L-alanine-DL-glutamate epimerase-like enolase superfamily enzyme
MRTAIRVQAVREAVGDKVELLLDVRRAWMADVVWLCREVEPSPFFIEDRCAARTGVQDGAPAQRFRWPRGSSSAPSGSFAN